MEETLYKIVTKVNDSYFSFAAMGKWCREFPIGVKVVPDKGYFYCFETMWAAEDFGFGFLEDATILRGVGEIVTHEPLIYTGSSDMYESFWNGEITGSTLLARGAVGAAWFKALDIVRP